MKVLSLKEINDAGEIDISHGVSYNDMHTLQRLAYTAREYHRLREALVWVSKLNVHPDDLEKVREALKEGGE